MGEGNGLAHLFATRMQAHRYRIRPLVVLIVGIVPFLLDGNRNLFVTLIYEVVRTFRLGGGVATNSGFGYLVRILVTLVVVFVEIGIGIGVFIPGWRRLHCLRGGDFAACALERERNIGGIVVILSAVKPRLCTRYGSFPSSGVSEVELVLSGRIAIDAALSHSIRVLVSVGIVFLELIEGIGVFGPAWCCLYGFFRRPRLRTRTRKRQLNLACIGVRLATIAPRFGARNARRTRSRVCDVESVVGNLKARDGLLFHLVRVGVPIVIFFVEIREGIGVARPRRVHVNVFVRFVVDRTRELKGDFVGARVGVAPIFPGLGARDFGFLGYLLLLVRVGNGDLGCLASGNGSLSVVDAVGCGKAVAFFGASRLGNGVLARSEVLDLPRIAGELGILLACGIAIGTGHVKGNGRFLGVGKRSTRYRFLDFERARFLGRGVFGVGVGNSYICGSATSDLCVRSFVCYLERIAGDLAAAVVV